ncbi:MAG: hypothetical protein ACREQ9_20195, partial [Candidatus Binatia bacterium]
AAAELAGRWAYGCRAAEVRLRRHYDEIVGSVELGGRTILDVRLRDPDILSVSDVQYTANVNPVNLAAGLRLVQVDPEFRISRAERGRGEVVAFESSAWSEEPIRPTFAVSACFTVADVVLPRVRFLCRPDVLAFEGTEQIAD